MKFFKTPDIVKSFYDKSIWDFPNAGKNLFLTFDDGPQPELTDYILKVLDQYKAKATFFCVGENLQKFPDLAKKIVLSGHEIGNHTFNHLNGWKTSIEEYINNIELFENAYLKFVNDTNFPYLFRPPYGKITRKQSAMLKEKGYEIIMWDILTYDFSNRLKVRPAMKRIIKKTKDGSIVVFHDNYKAQKNLEYLLPKYLDYFTARDYDFPLISSQIN